MTDSPTANPDDAGEALSFQTANPEFHEYRTPNQIGLTTVVAGPRQ
jgi:hypothetical protein